MASSGQDLAQLPSTHPFRLGIDPDSVPVRGAAPLTGSTRAAAACPSEAETDPAVAVGSGVGSRSAFDAAKFVEFADRHLEWLDRVEHAESAAWREVRSEGGRIYACVPPSPMAKRARRSASIFPAGSCWRRRRADTSRRARVRLWSEGASIGVLPRSRPSCRPMTCPIPSVSRRCSTLISGLPAGRTWCPYSSALRRLCV